ncbi:hypothetical protein, partial [Vallitalea sediminicola]
LMLTFTIRNTSHNKYSLFMRFSGVKVDLITGSKYSGSILCIRNKFSDKMDRYRIDQSRFSKDVSTYLNVSFAAERYYIKYSPSTVEKDYSRHWGAESEGFINNMMLFTYIGNKGNKVRINDEIEVNVKYYLMTSYGKRFVRERFIEYFPMGTLYLHDNAHQYQVYIIVIRANTEDDFRRASMFVRDKFKVNLVYQKTKVDLIWPPVVKGADEINYFGRSGDALYRICNGDQNESINIHQDYVHSTYQMTMLDYKSKLLRVPINKKNELMCLGESNTTLLYYLSNKKHSNIIRSNNEVAICDSYGNMLCGCLDALPKNSTINVKSNVKSEILLFRQGLFHSRYKLNENNIEKIQDIRYGDALFWKHYMKVQKLVEFSRVKEEIKKKVLTVSMKDIMYLSRTPVVGCKPWLKRLMIIMDREIQLNQVIKAYLRKGMIPVGVERLLYQKYCELGDEKR